MALSIEHSFDLPMRPAHEAMDARRLGSYYPFRLSFGRALTRSLIEQRWQITPVTIALDQKGAGEIVYSIISPNNEFTFAAFSNPRSADSQRHVVTDPDRPWEMTAALCAGQADEAYLDMLRQNVPKQEYGRLDTRSLVLTRGNRHTANFDSIAEELGHGRQPGLTAIAQFGYLYYITEVFGNGRFGMCDWSTLKTRYDDLARPFAAEMLAVYLLRQVSFDVVNHVARQRAPATAVTLDSVTRRYIGIGNLAGLGMVPFMIRHPLLVHRWIECRELALARVRAHRPVHASSREHLTRLLTRARQHLLETTATCAAHQRRNASTVVELGELLSILSERPSDTWESLIKAAQAFGLDAQEILNCCLIELHPDLVDDLNDHMSVDETYDIRPEQALSELKRIIETCYDWALAIDFGRPDSHAMFWFMADRNSQPRLGTINQDSGYEKRLDIAIARRTQDCYENVCAHLARNPADRVAHFLISFPELRSIVRRIQTMAQTRYGEIRVNVLDADFRPEQVIRCKLSFFGAGKFDSDAPLWVCNTLFQGAPIIDDLRSPSVARLPGDAYRNAPPVDDWSFAIMPERPDEILE